jgi:hypothetical protein
LDQYNNGPTYSEDFTFTAAVAPPSKPTLSSPSNGATGVSTSPTLSWNASIGATSCTLQVSEKSNFSSFVFNENVGNVTSKQVSGLSEGTTYYWRVIATNSGGSSDWSDTWIFITDSMKYNISGNVQYYYNNLPVSNVQISLTGNTSYLDSTSADGFYSFNSILEDNVTLTPSKNDDIGNAIGLNDALIILQKTAFIRILTDGQEKAGDVTRDTDCDNSDALAILRYKAFFTDNIGYIGEWIFKPENLSINLTHDTTGHDFTAYLLGDPTGDWGTMTFAKSDILPPAGIALGMIDDIAGNEIKIPVSVKNVQREINTIMLSLDYDQSIFLFKNIELTFQTNKYFVVVNNTDDGKIHIAMVGIEPIDNDCEIINIVFKFNEIIAQISDIELSIDKAQLNDVDVSDILTGVIKIYQTPNDFSLSQNYPNPFNPETNISFSLPIESLVTIEIYDILGSKIITLVNENMNPGIYNVLWDGTNQSKIQVSSGVYICKMYAGEFTKTLKMLLIR